MKQDINGLGGKFPLIIIGFSWIGKSCFSFRFSWMQHHRSLQFWYILWNQIAIRFFWYLYINSY